MLSSPRPAAGSAVAATCPLRVLVPSQAILCLEMQAESQPRHRDGTSSLLRVCAMMGSPDPNGRQLDGMGGGISSLSKVMIVETASDDEHDLADH